MGVRHGSGDRPGHRLGGAVVGHDGRLPGRVSADAGGAGVPTPATLVSDAARRRLSLPFRPAVALARFPAVMAAWLLRGSVQAVSSKT